MQVALDDDEGGDDDRARVVELYVWPCNLQAVAVFQLCAIACVGTFGGLHWSGIAAVELRAALELAGITVPSEAATDVAADVRYMGDAVAGERNRRAQVAARRK